VTNKQEGVLEHREAEREESIEPECNGDAGYHPSSRRVVDIVRLHNVFLRACDDCCHREEEGAKEETFALMLNGLLKRAWKFGEAGDHQRAKSCEHDKVKNIEECTNG
jgi:hypothetical protein